MKKVIVLTAFLLTLSVPSANATVVEDQKVCNKVTSITNISTNGTYTDLMDYFNDSSIKLKSISKTTKNKQLSKIILNMSNSYSIGYKAMSNMNGDKKDISNKIVSSGEKFINYCYNVNEKAKK